MMRSLSNRAAWLLAAKSETWTHSTHSVREKKPGEAYDAHTGILHRYRYGSGITGTDRSVPQVGLHVYM